jgi:hypothetical protein
MTQKTILYFRLCSAVYLALYSNYNFYVACLIPFDSSVPYLNLRSDYVLLNFKTSFALISTFELERSRIRRLQHSTVHNPDPNPNPTLTHYSTSLLIQFSIFKRARL